MKIGVVSDTHSHIVPKQVLDDFKTVDDFLKSAHFKEDQGGSKDE